MIIHIDVQIPEKKRKSAGYAHGSFSAQYLSGGQHSSHVCKYDLGLEIDHDSLSSQVLPREKTKKE